MNQSKQKQSSLAVIILAAGKGTRMKSNLAKVLHPLMGRPLLSYPLAVSRELGAERIVVVVGHQAERVEAAFAGEINTRFVLQEPQLGTGHAVMAAAPELENWQGPVLILCGDVPGLSKATLESFLAGHVLRGDALTVLGMKLEDPGTYGRLVTGTGGRLLQIVEYRDASKAERRIKLANGGVYAVQAGPLWAGLPLLSAGNGQKEYYLTDLVEIFNNQGLQVGYDVCADPREVAGINSIEQLRAVEEVLGEN